MQSRPNEAAIENNATRHINYTIRWGKQDSLDNLQWDEFYKELYSPLENFFGVDIVLQQFLRDKYLMTQCFRQWQIKREKNNTLDVTQLKNKSVSVTLKEVEYKSSSDGASSLYEAANYPYSHEKTNTQQCFNILNSQFCDTNLVNSATNLGWTALHIAIRQKNYDLVRLLCQYEANINLSTKGGRTPLHLAALFDQENIAKFLLSKGAALDIPENAGYTPLHLAVQKGHISIAKLLFEMGADPYRKTTDGKTAFDLIQANKTGEFQFLTTKVDLDTTNLKALECFIYFSAIRAYPKESLSDLQKAFNQLNMSSGSSRMADVQFLPISKEQKTKITNLLKELGANTNFLKSNDERMLNLLLPTDLAQSKQVHIVENKIDEPQIPDNFLCPISHEIMKNPVILPDGYSYEKTSIEQWLEKSKTSPITREVFDSKLQLIPNRALKELIVQYNDNKLIVKPVAETSSLPSKNSSLVSNSLFNNTGSSKQPVLSVLKSSAYLTKDEYSLLNDLIQACQNADLDKVKEYVEIHRVNPAMPGQRGKYALGEAIWNLAPQVVSYLLTKQQPAYTSEDLKTILASITKTHEVESVFCVPFDIKDFNVWSNHYLSKKAAWFYSYEDVKKREMSDCQVNWNLSKHITSVARPAFDYKTSPFIEIIFNHREKKGPIYGGNELKHYQEYVYQIQWAHQICNLMKGLLKNYGVCINANYTLEDNIQSNMGLKY